MRAALNQFSQELGDTFQVLCCGARPYGTQTPWAPVSQPAQRVQPKPPDVRQSLSRKQVSPHFWPTGRGAGVGGGGAEPPIVQSCFLPPYPYFNFTLNFNLTRHKYPRPIHIIF